MQVGKIARGFIVSQDKKSYHSLIVWKKAHGLVLEVYRATRSFPVEERFGLTSQLRRAVVSVPANIVEGKGRNTRAQMRQFLNIANGSLCEVEYYLELALSLQYLTEPQYEKLEHLRAEVGYLLNRYMNSQ